MTVMTAFLKAGEGLSPSLRGCGCYVRQYRTGVLKRPFVPTLQIDHVEDDAESTTTLHTAMSCVAGTRTRFFLSDPTKLRMRRDIHDGRYTDGVTNRVKAASQSWIVVRAIPLHGIFKRYEAKQGDDRHSVHRGSSTVPYALLKKISTTSQGNAEFTHIIAWSSLKSVRHGIYKGGPTAALTGQITVHPNDKSWRHSVPTRKRQLTPAQSVHTHTSAVKR